MNEVATRAAMMTAERVETGVVVKRAVGFAPTFEYVAEGTARVADGMVTVREGAHTVDGAVGRMRAAIQRRFTARKRAVGFAAEGFRARGMQAEFGVGFA